MTKHEKAKLLQSQHGCCALCRHKISTTEQACYDSVRHAILDRKCMMLISQVRVALERGISSETIARYENQQGPNRPVVEVISDTGPDGGV